MAVVVVRSEFMEENPEAVEVFLAEHEKVTDYITANVPDASAVVNKEINDATGKSLDEAVLSGAFGKIVFTTDVNEDAIREFADISLEQEFIMEDYKDIFVE